MHRKRGLVEIALELESGCIDESLIVRVVRDGRKLSRIEGSYPAQVYVEETVGAGKQARRFRRCMFSKLNDDEDRRRDRNHDQQNGERASNPHGERSEMG